jgi:predicted nucleic acid-binding protein
MRCLFDTNILVYRYDPRDPRKQAIASELLREKLEQGEAMIAQQCLVEFVAATTRKLRNSEGRELLDSVEAAYEAEELCRQFYVLYPREGQFYTALRGWRTYGLSWFDAHLWSFAEHYQIERLYSEDFQHDRIYGSVRVLNPFE